MKRLAAGVIAFIGIAFSATPAVAQANSHALIFNAGIVQCGVNTKNIGGITCFSRVVPTKYGTDGYIFLKAKGKPELGERGDPPFKGHSAPVTLKAGQIWGDAGVTCGISVHSVSCKNKVGNGFELFRHGYKTF